MTTNHDACPKCGGQKRTKNKQCADCRGYGRKRHQMPSGYMRVYTPGHPVASSDGYALEHHVVLHDAGVTIPAGYHVHHRNGDKEDNRLANLAVLTPRDHVRLHIEQAGGVTNQHGRFSLRQPQECETCGRPFVGAKRTSRYCSRLCSNRRECARIVGVS